MVDELLAAPVALVALVEVYCGARRMGRFTLSEGHSARFRFTNGDIDVA